PMPRKMKVRPAARDDECGALDVLWTECASHDRPEILTGDLVRREAVQPQGRDATGVAARDDFQIAEAVALEAAGAQRAQEISGVDVLLPGRLASAPVILARGQIPEIRRAGPDLRRPFSVTAARRAVENLRRRAAKQQHSCGGRGGGTLGRG